MTTKIVQIDPDPDWPNLPRISDNERRKWDYEQRWKRQLQEIEENAKTFNARLRPDMTPDEIRGPPYVKRPHTKGEFK